MIKENEIEKMTHLELTNHLDNELYILTRIAIESEV